MMIKENIKDAISKQYSKHINKVLCSYFGIKNILFFFFKNAFLKSAERIIKKNECIFLFFRTLCNS